MHYTTSIIITNYCVLNITSSHILKLFVLFFTFCLNWM